MIALPDLADGEYVVEYIFGEKTLKSPKQFKRIHFPWEKNTLGVGHKVYPPFLPVKTAGNSVAIVDRTYRLNQFGLFDSVLSQGRELLAEPMRIVCETDQGHVEWSGGAVRGSVQYDDLAVFGCRTESPAVNLEASVEVEEDGCAKVQMRLSAPAKPVRITKIWIQMPLKDEEAPLFHFAAANAMRLNYGGNTPRGQGIRWDLETQGWRPSLWTSSPGPVVDYEQPVQILRREKGRVILEIQLVQRPFTFAPQEERVVVFGLQASPTKPMEKE